MRAYDRFCYRPVEPLYCWLAVCLCLFVSVPTAWCLPPAVVFNGVAAVLDTVSTPLNHPKGVTVDNAGNVFIADTAHNQIVKVTPAGAASVLVITGLTAGLSAPEGIALDSSGNLYVADTGNNRIVMLSSACAGSVVDLGGTALASPRGVAIDAAGNLYFADTGNNRIVKLTAGGSAAVLNITGLGTPLSSPVGLAVDVPGNLYIGDSGNNRIVKVTNVGAGSALSISGLGTALSTPTSVAVDSFANVYIADSGNNRIVEVISGAGSVLSTGSLTLNTPVAVALDISGQVYVADTSNSRVVSLMKSAVSFGQLEVGALSGKSLTLPFTVGVAATLGSVRALTLGAQSLDFTLGAGTTCADGTTNTTCNVEVQFLPLASGLRRGAVALFDQSNTLLAVVPIYGTGGAPMAVLSPGTASIISTGGVSLNSPFGAAIDGAGNIYVGNYTGSNVVKIAAGGGSASVVSTGGLTIFEACGVVVDGAGNLYIADYGHNRIVVVKSTGATSVLTVSGLGTAINQPAGLALDGSGNLYIADWGNNQVVEVTPAGAGYVVATGSYTLTASGITGVAVDPSGNIYVADRVANHVVKVAPSGAASLVSVAGLTLSNPQGIAADGNGNLYIADAGHRRVVQVTAAGTASVVPTAGQAIGSIMYGVTVDAGGNLFAVDWSNNRLLKVTVSGTALSFANTTTGTTSSDSPKTVTVTNLGNEALVFSANPSYTADFSENTADANLCTSSTSLDAGEVCNVSILFTPQSAGSKSQFVVLTDNHLNASAVTQSIAVSGTGVSPTTPTITWAQPSAIAYGTTLSGLLNATATDGSSAVDGIFAYTATLQGGSTGSVTSSTLLGAGNYTLSTSFTPTDSTAYTAATGSVSLTVDKISPSVALTSSGNPALVSTSITLTATVSSSVSTPSGSVDFYDATTHLGSGTISSGIATYSTSSLTAGTHSITAVYAGDSNFVSVTSSAASQVVADLNLSTASGGSSTATVSPGGTATYHLTIAPSAGSTFPAAINLSGSGGPAGSTITVAPQTISAGASSTNVSVAVQVPTTIAAIRMLNGWALALVLPLAGLMMLPFASDQARTRRGMPFALLLSVVLLSIAAIVGCGSHTTAPTTRQPTNYTITVTAASGSVSHSTTLTLTVQ